MMIPSRRTPRSGYTLTVVLVFLILLFALWSTVYRTTASLLRIETNRTLQQTRDQGAMNALAQAIQLLQYSAPFDTTNPGRTQFTYGIQVTVTNPAVEYTPAPAQGTNCWQVQITPGTSSVPLPAIGANPQWP
jgi:hypothetical protein